MRLLRIDEAAHRLGLKPSTVRKLVSRGQIPVVRPTKRAVRIREEDVDALIRVGYRDPGSRSRQKNVSAPGTAA